MAKKHKKKSNITLQQEISTKLKNSIESHKLYDHDTNTWKSFFTLVTQYLTLYNEVSLYQKQYMDIQSGGGAEEAIQIILRVGRLKRELNEEEKEVIRKIKVKATMYPIIREKLKEVQSLYFKTYPKAADSLLNNIKSHIESQNSLLKEIEKYYHEFQDESFLQYLETIQYNAATFLCYINKWHNLSPLLASTTTSNLKDLIEKARNSFKMKSIKGLEGVPMINENYAPPYMIVKEQEFNESLKQYNKLVDLVFPLANRIKPVAPADQSQSVHFEDSSALVTEQLPSVAEMLDNLHKFLENTDLSILPKGVLISARKMIMFYSSHTSREVTTKLFQLIQDALSQYSKTIYWEDLSVAEFCYRYKECLMPAEICEVLAQKAIEEMEKNGIEQDILNIMESMYAYFISDALINNNIEYAKKNIKYIHNAEVKATLQQVIDLEEKNESLDISSDEEGNEKASIPITEEELESSESTVKKESSAIFSDDEIQDACEAGNAKASVPITEEELESSDSTVKKDCLQKSYQGEDSSKLDQFQNAISSIYQRIHEAKRYFYKEAKMIKIDHSWQGKKASYIFTKSQQAVYDVSCSTHPNTYAVIDEKIDWLGEDRSLSNGFVRNEGQNGIKILKAGCYELKMAKDNNRIMCGTKYINNDGETLLVFNKKTTHNQLDMTLSKIINVNCVYQHSQSNFAEQVQNIWSQVSDVSFHNVWGTQSEEGGKVSHEEPSIPWHCPDHPGAACGCTGEGSSIFEESL